jgi:hypothetical protein
MDHDQARKWANGRRGMGHSRRERDNRAAKQDRDRPFAGRRDRPNRARVLLKRTVRTTYSCGEEFLLETPRHRGKLYQLSSSGRLVHPSSPTPSQKALILMTGIFTTYL